MTVIQVSATQKLKLKKFSVFGIYLQINTLIIDGLNRIKMSLISEAVQDKRKPSCVQNNSLQQLQTANLWLMLAPSINAKAKVQYSRSSPLPRVN